MVNEVVEDEMVQKTAKKDDEGHCRCKTFTEDHSESGKDVEKPTLIKDSYYSKVSSKYQETKGRAAATNKGFHQIRQDCLNAQTLFVDDDFPPTNTSITFNGVTQRQYEWKRPHEICKDPHLFVEGATRFDIQQGEIGDCWLLAAISTLTLNPRIFHVVVPRDQSMKQMYSGIFHFRFWQYGKWQDVYVDDLLPTYCGRLVFMHSKTDNEFWCALLEKAYAKLYGCYEALKGGNINESMVDLTGGVVEMITLNTPPSNLFHVMRKAYHRSALMGCAIEPQHPGAAIEHRLANGLIQRHAYSVTRVTKAEIPRAKAQVELVRLHNPWGNEAEWTGAWSDQSPEWKLITPEERQRLGITFDDDGEFWMPFEDFVRNFTTLEICDTTPESFTGGDDVDDDVLLSEMEVLQRWRMAVFEGAWVTGKTAGGCRNFIDTFSQNPQYTVFLQDADDEDDECTLVVSLMQKNIRQMKRFGAEYRPIGFAIYKLPEDHRAGQHIETDYFKYNASVAKVPHFLNTREVTSRFRFPPGVYVIIPSTFDPFLDAEFLLRVYTEAPKNSVVN